MKLVPDAIARKVAGQQLLASQHAPRILFVGGVVGMVGSTVLACRATLNLEAVLDQIENDKRVLRETKLEVDRPDYDGEATYPDKEFGRDMARTSVIGIGKIVKLYAPSVAVGAISITALTKSHNILEDRNLALTAAYAAVDRAFNNYRERVVDRYGEDVDRELRFESETIDIIDDETGEIVAVTRATGTPGSVYARFFDRDSSRLFSTDPDVNIFTLRSIQTYANDRLRARGHVFLNEVYDELGLSHTREGAIVGWRWQKGSGDDYIDFGIWDGNDQAIYDFFNGREGAILLDFNVDGPIFDKLEGGIG